MEIQWLNWVGYKVATANIVDRHIYAKLIEIQTIYLQKIHALHELESHMEWNNTLHGSELGPHWVLGPKNSKFGPMGPKKLLKNFFTQS